MTTDVGSEQLLLQINIVITRLNDTLEHLAGGTMHLPSIRSLSFAVLSAMYLGTVCNRAHADSFTFTATLDSGPSAGIIAGTFNITSLIGGSGTGSASALTFTSIPAGLGPLAGGNIATSWTDQISNSFTVVNGIVISDLFFATTAGNQPASLLCLNSTATATTYGSFSCVSQLNELNSDQNDFAYNFGGLSGITFKDTGTSVSATPEPGTLTLFGTGMLGLVGAIRRRHTVAARQQRS